MINNKFTMNTKYRAAVATPLIVAGVYVAWTYVGRAWRKKGASKRKDDENNKKKVVAESSREKSNISKASSGTRVLSRSVSMGAIHGGKAALQRLLDFHTYRVDGSALKNAESEFEKRLADEQPKFGLLQGCVVKLEMIEKEAEGIEMLKQALEKAREQKKLHEAYEFEMLLVEMLIYKGEIEEASKCKCLDDEMITDARRPLYKAIVHIFRGDPEKQAMDLFEEFKDIQSNFQWPQSSEDSEGYKAIPSFEEFKKVVESLKQDIEEAKKTQSGKKKSELNTKI